MPTTTLLMPRIRRASLRLPVLLVMAFSLFACSSPAEKANELYRKGMALYDKGGQDDLVQADKEFRNSIGIKKSAQAIYGLALVAERQGKMQELFSYLSQTLDIDPNQLPAEVKMGTLLLEAGQLARASEISERTLRLDPSDLSVRVLHAGVLKAQGDAAGARKLVQAVLAAKPDSTDALEFMAQDLFDAGQTESAIVFADRGIKVDSGNIRLQLLKTQALDKLGRTDEAESVLRTMIAQHPENRRFQAGLVQFLMAHNRRDAAEAELRAIANRNPSDIQARLDVVRFVETTKGTQAAIAELQSAVLRQPKDAELKFALASIQQSGNDIAAAEKTIRSVIDVAGDSRDGLKAKGILAGYLLASGNRDQAMSLVKDVLAKDQRNEQALVLKANVELGDGQINSAVEDLRTVLQDVPDSSRALLLLGKAHESQGNFDLADDFYSRAFQASRADANYCMAYAEFLMRRNQSSRAESMLNDMLKTHPGNLALLEQLAKSKTNLGDWDGAMQIAEQIEQIKKARS